MFFNKNVNIAAAAVAAGLTFGVARLGRAQSLPVGMEKTNPILYLWHVIKDGLAMRGEGFFVNLKDAEVPGPDFTDTDTHPPPRFFKAKIISMTPAIGPKELTVGIEKGDVADAKIVFFDKKDFCRARWSPAGRLSSGA